MAAASSKPPLKRNGNPSSAAQAVPSSAANPEPHAFEEEDWWDPTDPSKVSNQNVLMPKLHNFQCH